MNNHRFHLLYLPIYLRVKKFTPGKRILLYLFQATVIVSLVGFLAFGSAS